MLDLLNRVVLPRFSQAETAAHTALVRDPHSVKARYRRVMARKELNRLAEALVDLATLLTVSPENVAASSALEDIALYVTSDLPRISHEDIVTAEFQPAFGCTRSWTECSEIVPTAAIRPRTSPARRRAYQTPDVGHMLILRNHPHAEKHTHMPEGSPYPPCRALLHLTFPTQCKRATHCNVVCQRAAWFVVCSFGFVQHGQQSHYPPRPPTGRPCLPPRAPHALRHPRPGAASRFLSMHLAHTSPPHSHRHGPHRRG
ncbi:hypothetical protein C8R43DRAFT_611703 [Mycena crocata]|nr:hypothetical protein C8R43DRAFT_611703 [Mycena crocata]